MKHRTAIVLLGWLLMMPPLEDGSTISLDEKAPITRWDQAMAYDTATQCEDSKTRLWEARMERSGPDHILTHQIELCRCVPAEHVYGPKAKRKRNSSAANDYAQHI